MTSSTNLFVLVCILASVNCATTSKSKHQHQSLEYYNLTASPQFAPFFGKTLKGNFWFGYQYCKSIGMQVVTPDTPQKLALLVEFMKKHNLVNVCTSGSDLAKEGNFIWMVNSKPLDFADWHTAQPDDARKNEDCLGVWNVNGVYKMNDHPCADEYPIVCEPIVPCYYYDPNCKYRLCNLDICDVY